MEMARLSRLQPRAAKLLTAEALLRLHKTFRELNSLLSSSAYQNSAFQVQLPSVETPALFPEKLLWHTDVCTLGLPAGSTCVD